MLYDPSTKDLETADHGDDDFDILVDTIDIIEGMFI
jgi:hypothetical protein